MASKSPSQNTMSAGAIAERAFDPPRFLAAAREASDEQIVELYQQTRRIGGVIWMSAAICCGIAYERAEAAGQEVGIEALAKALETHQSEISRMARTYRLIFVPRCSEQGEGATFPITQRKYYDLACDAAIYSNKPATEILAIAEDRRAAGRFTAREFKALLIEMGLLPDTKSGTPDSAAPRVLAHLKALSMVPGDVLDAAIDKMVKGKTAEWQDVVAGVGRLIDRIERDLSVALDEGEEQQAAVG